MSGHSSGLFCVWIGRDRSVTGGGPGEGSRESVLQGLGCGLEGGWGMRTQCLMQRDRIDSGCRRTSSSLMEGEGLVAEAQCWLLLVKLWMKEVPPR